MENIRKILVSKIPDTGKKADAPGGRRAEIGEDKVFDFSLGNPSVPAPESVRETLRRLIDQIEKQSL